jgi:hypothetical protein
MAALKLLVSEANEPIQYIIKEDNRNAMRDMYIEGIYLMAEKENRNGRIYSQDEMDKEVKRYEEQMIKTHRALGELNHPTSAEINPERSCHIIESLKKEGNYYMGRSKILSTPMGQLVKSLLLDGVKLGVSSRALGTLSEDDGARGNRVSNFHLLCVDVVSDPSVHTAFVEGVLESKNWVLNSDGTCKECNDIFNAYNVLEKKLGSLPKKDANVYIQEQVRIFLKNLH